MTKQSKLSTKLQKQLEGYQVVRPPTRKDEQFYHAYQLADLTREEALMELKKAIDTIEKIAKSATNSKDIILDWRGCRTSKE